MGAMQDIRYALRRLRQSPGFAATSLATIALAVGAITAIFTIVNAVLLRALPYPEPDRLVRLYAASTSEPLERRSMSLPDLADWESGTAVVVGAAAYLTLPTVLLGRGDPRELRAAYVTQGFFGVLGAAPLLGRWLDAEDERLAGRNAVISRALWQASFGADSAVVGTTISLQGESYTVVGVADTGFRFPAADVALWLPQSVLSDRAVGARTRDNRDFDAIARLRSGVSIDSAARQLREAAAWLAAEHPQTNRRLDSAVVVPLRETIVGHVERALLLVFFLAAVIASIGCVNLANLLLARGVARSRELAARIALGASRMRLVRQQLTESVVLALLGGALGLGVALAGVRLFLAVGSAFLPRVEDVRIDYAVLAFAVACSIAVGLIAGGLPAWLAARVGPARLLGTGKGIAGSGRTHQAPLVAAEVALAVVLVAGGALMARSFIALRAVEPGFDSSRVLTATLQVSLSAIPDGLGVPVFLLQRRREIVERVAALPGVVQAAVTSRLPLRDGAARFAFRLAGSGERDQEPFTADARNVSRDYFLAMGIPLLRGSTPVQDAPLTFGTDRDRFEGQRPIAVSASAAQRFWPGEDAVGKVIDGGWFEAVVVGVVGDVRHVGLAAEPEPTLYFPDGPQLNATLVVRSSGDPALLVGPIREVLRNLDPNQSIRSFELLDDVVTGSIASDRLFTTLYVTFGIIALLLAVVGIYGVVAYSTRLRTGEIGLRVAIGASTGDILRNVLVNGMKPVLVGVALGLCTALVLARAIAHQLFEIEAHDPLALIGAALVLVAAALAACYVPAKAAARSDPTVALRVGETV